MHIFQFNRHKRRSAFLQMLWIAATLVAVFWTGDASALPPLGLTEIGSAHFFTLPLAIDSSGDAYVGDADRLIRINSAGNVAVGVVAHPELGSPVTLSNVVEGVDSRKYFTANFYNEQAGRFLGGALYGVDVKFEIDEANPSWSEVEKLVAEWKSLDVVCTEFSKVELSNAQMLRMASTWQHGYPEPNDEMGFLKETYVESSICKVCGSGGVQQHSFRLKQEPKWGNRQVLQLNWVFDEFFVQPETWRPVFHPSLLRVNEKQLALDAAAYADNAGLWVGNKAKIILDRPIGVHGTSGALTNGLNIYRTKTGFVHNAPGTPQ